VLPKLLCYIEPRAQRLDVLDLHLFNGGEDVPRPLLDQRHEAAVAQRAVRAAVGEVVWERGHADAQVGDDVVAAAPHGAQVGPVRDEGEARHPGCVEAGGADDDVDVVVGAGRVGEAGCGDFADGVGEDGGVGGDEGFEVAGGRGGPAAAGVEVFGDDLVDEVRVGVELALHLGEGELAGFVGFAAAFDDEFEALVELVFDLFAVFEVFLRVVL